MVLNAVKKFFRTVVKEDERDIYAVLMSITAISYVRWLEVFPRSAMTYTHALIGYAIFNLSLTLGVLLGMIVLREELETIEYSRRSFTDRLSLEVMVFFTLLISLDYILLCRFVYNLSLRVDVVTSIFAGVLEETIRWFTFGALVCMGIPDDYAFLAVSTIWVLSHEILFRIPLLAVTRVVALYTMSICVYIAYRRYGLTYACLLHQYINLFIDFIAIFLLL